MFASFSLTVPLYINLMMTFRFLQLVCQNKFWIFKLKSNLKGNKKPFDANLGGIFSSLEIYYPYKHTEIPSCFTSWYSVTFSSWHAVCSPEQFIEASWSEKNADLKVIPADWLMTTRTAALISSILVAIFVLLFFVNVAIFLALAWGEDSCNPTYKALAG